MLDTDRNQPFQLRKPAESTVAVGPLVLSSPHSGRNYTAEFRAASRLDDQTLRLSEDCFVDELFASAPSHGAAMIAATYPRAYLDVNREPLELDPRMFDDPLPYHANTRSERVAAGLGTIARVVSTGLPIYDSKLSYAQEKTRIEAIYRPYHAALQSLLDEARARNGYAILIDCHSMPSMPLGQPGLSGQTDHPHPDAPSHIPVPLGDGQRPHDPDIILGDRFGTSCAPELTDRIEATLRDMGYSVARNDPYAGGYCTIRYGRPRAGVHGIQIEISRRLYMDERRIRRRKKAMQQVAGDMDRLIAAVSAVNLSSNPTSIDRLAAE